jgi:hypothetical protein
MPDDEAVDARNQDERLGVAKEPLEVGAPFAAWPCDVGILIVSTCVFLEE